jgi:hypothetical protein
MFLETWFRILGTFKQFVGSAELKAETSFLSASVIVISNQEHVLQFSVLDSIL